MEQQGHGNVSFVANGYESWNNKKTCEYMFSSYKSVLQIC